LARFKKRTSISAKAHFFRECVPERRVAGHVGDGVFTTTGTAANAPAYRRDKGMMKISNVDSTRARQAPHRPQMRANIAARAVEAPHSDADLEAH
jgi:hypothetical protein